MKNSRIRLSKKHMQINIHKLRDRKHVVSQSIHKSEIIKGEVIIYLDNVGTKHLNFLIIPKSYILFV
jgi:hypothetical protein